MRYMNDAQQQALAFLQSQLSEINTTVYRIQYPDVQYPGLIPVITGGNEWLRSITFYSLDRFGVADWFHHMAKDVPLADITREKFEQTIEMAAVGYFYTMEELAVAAATRTALTAERAEAARRASEEFIDEIALRGDPTKGLEGLINRSDVTAISVPADGERGATGSPYFRDKDDTQVIRDINAGLSNIFTGSRGMEMADTILMPEHLAMELSARVFGVTTMTLMAWIMQNNYFTQQTGRQLTIRTMRGLDTADDEGGGRMVFYRNDPQVIGLHIPMQHRFLPIWQTGPMRFDVPGIFRLGGVEIRRPGAIRYIDNVSAGPVT